MCFSATSSFVVASALTITGIVTYKYATSKRQIPLALVPLGFAIQQAAEGLVWLTLEQPQALIHKLAMYIFLGFAFVIWPLWIPWAIKVYEQDHTRKMLLSICQLIGLLFAITALFLLWSVPASVTNNGNLVYQLQHDFFGEHSSIAWYVIPVILPFFIASNRIFSMALGALLTISLAASYVIKPQALISMWCFLAAVISLAIIGVVWSEKSKRSTILY